MRRLTLQVLDSNYKLIYSKESVSGCPGNCLEQQALGFMRVLKAYFNNPGANGFKKIAGLGQVSPHTVVAFFTDKPEVMHYEDLEIDAETEYVTQENIEKCLLERFIKSQNKGVCND